MEKKFFSFKETAQNKRNKIHKERKFTEETKH